MINFNRRIIHLFVRHSFPMLFTLALLGSSAIMITTRFLKAEQEKVAIQKLHQIKTYFDIVLEEMDSLNIMFSTNPSIVNRLKTLLESASWSLQDTRDIRNMRNYISAPANARAYIDSIYIYQENRKNRLLTSISGVIDMKSFPDKGWIQAYEKQSPDTEIWAQSREILPVIISQGKEEIITIYRAIYNGSGTRTGVMVLNLLKNKLKEDNPARLSEYGEIVTISDEDGNLLLTLGEDEAIIRQKTVTFSLKSDRFKWNFDMMVPVTELNRLSGKLSLLTLGIALIALFFGFIITYRSNRKERNFIFRTLTLLEQARGMKMDTPGDSKQENLFDFMTERILQTFLEQDYLKIRKEAMEYRALQMQINPHFLFNTLENINWKAIKLLNGPNDISKMISLMSKILKYAISLDGTESVTIEQEVMHSGYYLEVQNARFPNRFVVTWNIAPELLDYRVPRLIFQPILENSFNHGLKTDDSTLEITISAKSENENVLISIKDDGRGFEAPHSGKLKMEADWVGTTHIGLQNVQKRLFLFFSGNVEMHLNSSEGKGTEVLFLLPGTSVVPGITE